MKHAILALIALVSFQFVIGQTTVYTKKNTANNTSNFVNAKRMCQIPKFEPPYLDTAVVYSKFLRLVSNNFDQSMARIVHEPEVDSICFDASTGHLTLHAKDEQDKGTSIFIWAKNAYLRWEFDIYHDIYKSFFYFKKVKKISIIINRKEMTAIPCIGDYDMVIAPNNTILRRWYIPCLDYASMFDRDVKYNYQDFSKRIISSKILDSISRKMKF